MYHKITYAWFERWDFLFLDMIFLQLAYIFSYWVRNGLNNPYANKIYLDIALAICFINLCAALFLDSYRDILRRGYFLEFVAVLKHVAAVSASEVIYLFLSKNGQNFSRISFVVFVLSAIVLLYAERVGWKFYLIKHKKSVPNKRLFLVVTTYDMAEDVIQTLKNNAFNELEVEGVVLVDRGDQVGENIYGTKVVCREDEILDYIQTRWVDDILINLTDESLLPKSVIGTFIKMGVTVHRKVVEIGKISQNQRLEAIGGYVVLSSNIRMVSIRQLFIKRLMDIVGSIVGLALTGVLAVFIAPAIYINSPGPVFFTQIRVGRNGRLFKIHKFRSMYQDAEMRKHELLDENKMKGFMFKVDHDPRIIGSGPDGTKHGIGWFIRKTSIDEFPQFWNVLKGEMSLVGTRPPTVDEWEQYEHHHRGRLAIKPGLTGLWQVSGRSNITDFEEVVRLDVEYIQTWDIGLDIKIMLKTILNMFRGIGAD